MPRKVVLGGTGLVGVVTLLAAFTYLTIAPRLPTLKEWAYAGFTFMWIAAVVAHYLAGDGALSLLPVSLLGSLALSCVTRPANRGGSAKALLRRASRANRLATDDLAGGIGELFP